MKWIFHILTLITGIMMMIGWAHTALIWGYPELYGLIACLVHVVLYLLIFIKWEHDAR